MNKIQYCSTYIKLILPCKNYILAKLKIKLILCHLIKTKLKN